MRLLVIAVAAAFLMTVKASDRPPDARPKLLVLLVFDQLRGDYLVRWGDLFGPDGFRRLTDQGLWFTECHYPYACTMTAPGHASVLTGCSPDRHGIIMNEWFDRPSGREVEGGTSDRASTVYSTARPPAAAGSSRRKDGAGSPERLLAESLGDVLTAEASGRVVSVSLKDRSATLPGGRRPEACYWFDSRSGSFVTSSYYRERPHDWADRFNAGGRADAWLGQTWKPLRRDVDYTALSGPDEVASESAGVTGKMGRAFPHVLGGGKSKVDKSYYDDVTCSPFGNDLLFEFAKLALRETGLGRGPGVDLLSVSFSSNDLVGHAFGPDSHEVMDMTLRSDRTVADLLAELNATVGRGKYVVALTADHGICPIPEVMLAKGQSAGRLHPDQVRAAVEAFLNGRYSVKPGDSSRWIEADAFPWIYFNHGKITARGLAVEEVAEALAGWVPAQPWGQAAFTRRTLTGPAQAGDAIAASMRKAFHPERSGDVGIVLKPYYISTTYPGGTTHGSPHGYDTHVPLVFYGPGMAPGKSTDAVTPQAIAAVLARAAGVRPPAQAEAPVPARCLSGTGN